MASRAMFSPPSSPVSSSSVMKRGILFIMAMISSAVCCFTDSIAGGMAGPTPSGFLLPSFLGGKAAPAAFSMLSRDGPLAASGALFRSIFSSKSSGSSSTLEDDMMMDALALLSKYGSWSCVWLLFDLNLYAAMALYHNPKSKCLLLGDAPTQENLQSWPDVVLSELR